MKRNNLAYQPHAFSIEYIDSSFRLQQLNLREREQIVTAIQRILLRTKRSHFFSEN